MPLYSQEHLNNIQYDIEKIAKQAVPNPASMKK